MLHRSWGKVLRHLVEAGILDGGEALAGGLAVEPASRSNQVGIVRSGDRPVLVLKRHRVACDEADPMLAEASAHWWLASRPTMGTMAPALITVLGRTLVFEALDGLRPFHECVDSDEDLAARFEALGQRLALLHSAPVTGEELPPRRPWVLDIPLGKVPAIFSADPGIRSFTASIRDDRPLRAALEELDRSWKPLAPIHGDVKFDNILVDIGGGEKRPRVALVDWELAGLGLPVWDIAGLLEGLLVPSVQRMGIDDALTDLEPAWCGVRAYRSAVATSLVPDDRSLLVATVARLVQSSIQLLAMRHVEPHCEEGSGRVLEGAQALSDRMPEGATRTAWVA